MGWLAALFQLWLLCVAMAKATLVQEIMKPFVAPAENRVSFSEDWNCLGPFAIGTREAIWGADPLEAFGGFHSLSHDENAVYASSLGKNGTVGWHTLKSSPKRTANRSSVDLAVDFPHQDWHMMHQVYGWSALQYQAWIRGHVTVAGDKLQRVAFSADEILEYRVNGQPVFGGDFYAFRKAPTVIDLPAGRNVIDVRLVREVRSMGGTGETITKVGLAADIVKDDLHVDVVSLLVSDLLENRLPSPLASVIVRNDKNEWISIVDCTAIEGVEYVEILGRSAVQIAPGQSRSVAFSLRLSQPVSAAIQLRLIYTIAGVDRISLSQLVQIRPVRRKATEPHKFTFLHSSGVVSYAVLRPPLLDSELVTAEAQVDYPLLLALHGAGLEADGLLVRHMLDAVPDLKAWALCPTGTTPWSADDWHTWGLADVDSAVAAVHDWMKEMEWKGPGVQLDKWLVTGHSNGGQGTWHIVSHRPDNVIGAAAVSGYTSIEKYVPYSFWRDSNPLQKAVVQTSLSSFQHELFVENMADIPIVQQHGTDDDNVPVYHSRLMSSLLAEAGYPSQCTELSGRGHWFPEVMTTKNLQHFYRKVLSGNMSHAKSLQSFSAKIPNSADMRSRFGIEVDQLESPDILGWINVDVKGNGTTLWCLETTNIHRLHIHKVNYAPAYVRLDNTELDVPLAKMSKDMTFVKTSDGKWQVDLRTDWRNLHERYGRQRGFLDAILRTRGSFQLLACAEDEKRIALQISRNLLQYFSADSEVVDCTDQSTILKSSGSVITIALGRDLPASQLENFPLQVLYNGVHIRRKHSATAKTIPLTAGLGLAFLRPLPNERLELVLWGYDIAGLRQAARLVPTLTGAGQPDFVIFGNEGRWKGHAGTLAMGFFDHSWNISDASYIP